MGVCVSDAKESDRPHLFHSRLVRGMDEARAGG
jgi:hypothetical protein